jgi:glycosyltransferase involved in cell wall biosynthesis
MTQTLPAREIILVDDGTTDRSSRLAIQSILNEYRNLRLFRQRHKGPAAARNRGLDEISGCYVAFVDADDRLRDDNLAHRYALISSDERVISAYSGFEVVGSSSQTRFSRFRSMSAETLRTEDVGKPNGVPGGLPFYLFRVSELRAIGGLDESLSIMEDFDLIARLAKRGHLFSGANEPTYFRTFRQASHSRYSSKRRFLGTIKFLEKARKRRYFGARELCRRYILAAGQYLWPVRHR